MEIATVDIVKLVEGRAAAVATRVASFVESSLENYPLKPMSQSRFDFPGHSHTTISLADSSRSVANQSSRLPR
jgi:hypothetical protein